jgi:hypothetical protein
LEPGVAIVLSGIVVVLLIIIAWLLYATSRFRGGVSAKSNHTDGTKSFERQISAELYVETWRGKGKKELK